MKTFNGRDTLKIERKSNPMWDDSFTETMTKQQKYNSKILRIKRVKSRGRNWISL